jgi:hypothetical protein
MRHPVRRFIVNHSQCVTFLSQESILDPHGDGSFTKAVPLAR